MVCTQYCGVKHAQNEQCDNRNHRLQLPQPFDSILRLSAVRWCLLLSSASPPFDSNQPPSSIPSAIPSAALSELPYTRKTCSPNRRATDMSTGSPRRTPIRRTIRRTPIRLTPTRPTLVRPPPRLARTKSRTTLPRLRRRGEMLTAASRLSTRATRSAISRRRTACRCGERTSSTTFSGPCSTTIARSLPRPPTDPKATPSPTCT